MDSGGVWHVLSGFPTVPWRKQLHSLTLRPCVLTSDWPIGTDIEAAWEGTWLPATASKCNGVVINGNEADQSL